MPALPDGGNKYRSNGKARLLALPVLIVMWSTVAEFVDTPLMPSVWSIASGLVLILTTEPTSVLISIARVLAGVALGGIVGFVLGTILTHSQLLVEILMPLIDAARSTAGLAIYPLIILFLGLGETAKVFLVFWGAWPAVLLNTMLGLTTVERSVVEAARVDGAGTWTLFRHITMPLAIPTVLTGLQIGAGIGWIGLVASEMMVGSSGLGYLILANTQVFRFSEAYAAVVLVSLCGLATHFALHNVQRILKGKVVG
jgi:ABC-type nitrate/sulfonate/bicarbonate transport system permease component